MPPGKTELVLWAHNGMDYFWLNTARRLPQAFKIVAVSDFQRYGMVGHKIYPQTISIPNPAPADINWQKPLLDFKPAIKQILYIGALKPSKGFHHLAKAWPRFRAQNPEFKLVVCGSGKLYDPSATLGMAGLTDTEYEHRILSYLGGSLVSANQLGVEFLGALPKARLREEVLRSWFVVVNPNLHGSFETFCCSAVEALSLGVPVVAARRGALVETVGHEIGGLLFRNSEEFLDMMDLMVKDIALRDRLALVGYSHVTEAYSREKITQRWFDFFEGHTIHPFCNEISPWVTWRFHAKLVHRALPEWAGIALRCVKNYLGKL